MLRTRDDKQMMTAEELRLLGRKRRRVVLTLVLVLALGVAGYFGARPAFNVVKAWQARRHATKAFALIEQQKWQEAKNEAVAAYQLRPAEPEAIRAVARFLSRTRQQQAFEFWDQLEQTQPLTRDDLRDEAAVALASGELHRAAGAIDRLLGKEGSNAAPLDWLLAAQLRLQQGAPDQALDSLGKLLAHPAASARDRFQATILQLQAARTGNAELDSRNQREAWERLAQFAQADDVVALDSLVLLAQRQLAQGQKTEDRNQTSDIGDQNSNAAGSSSPSDFRLLTSDLIKPDELIHRLESHPLAKAPQRLLATDLRMQVNPDQRDALITQAIAEWRNAEASQLAVLATWLNGKGEFQRVLDEIPLERAIQSREVFLQHLDALGAVGRWDEIKHVLDTERFPLDPVIQRMYLARANAQLGQDAASKNNWQRALEAAAGDVGKLMTLAEYAEKNGATEIAESAYTQATTAAPKLRQAWQGRLRSTSASRDTKRIRDLLAEMLKLWPNDPSIQNDEAYMRLLLLSNADPANAELIEIEHLAEELVRRFPASLPHRTLLALARLKQRRPVAALQAYDGVQVAANALTPSALAVHAATMSANGQVEVAQQEIAQVPADRLLPEERAGIANLRE
jgi:hypothetical protein